MISNDDVILRFEQCSTLETLSEKSWINENINWFIGILGIITHYDS